MLNVCVNMTTAKYMFCFSFKNINRQADYFEALGSMLSINQKSFSYNYI